MKPADEKSNTYIKSSKEINDEDRKFKIGDNVRISKYRNIFAKVGTFYEKELQKTNQKEFRIKR